MEREVSVREASLDDIAPLVAVQAASPGAAAWGEGDYKSFLLADGAVCLLAEDGSDDVVGFLLARAVADEMEILNLAVVPAQRRRGLARRLVAEALGRGHAQGVTQCWLEVRASNRTALGFYRALGFQEHTRRPNYYRNPVEDAVLCVRRLASAAGPAA